jgi:hypothetical protein
MALEIAEEAVRLETRPVRSFLAQLIRNPQIGSRYGPDQMALISSRGG